MSRETRSTLAAEGPNARMITHWNEVSSQRWIEAREPIDDPERRDAVTAAVREALAEHVAEDGVRLGGAAWIVTGRNPA